MSAPRVSGFTLLELITAIAIIGILAAIAIPSYQKYVLRSHLTEALDALSAYQVQMEHYYQDAGNYGATPACGVTQLPANTQYFTFSCKTPTTQTYTATATGTGLTTGYTYTVDDSSTPRKTLTYGGVAQTGKTCWIVRVGDC